MFTKTNIKEKVSLISSKFAMKEEQKQSVKRQMKAITWSFVAVFILTLNMGKEQPLQAVEASIHYPDISSIMEVLIETTDFIAPEFKELKPQSDWANKDKIIANINSFIDQYGRKELNTSGELWYNHCTYYNIHPYFCVSVAFADTTIGKNLTTSYNLGNVGNTDSCPTCTPMQSWEQGIKAIAQTLANNYLGTGYRVCDFSRGGWVDCPDSPLKIKNKFYASSEKNWNRNTAWAFNWMLGKEYNSKQEIKWSFYLDK